MTDQDQGIPACIVLVYGLPASGKTLLTTSLVEYSSKDTDMMFRNWIAVHFDDFYPPDTRYENDSQNTQESSSEPFVLKESRHKVNDCLEYFISLNHLGRTTHSDDELQTTDCTIPAQWDRFVECVNKNGQPIVDDSGRLRQEFQRPTVLILDDNMPLSSIRHEYYQLARQYQMGFMEVCVLCSLEVAVMRNSFRLIPITNSTLETMGQSMEIPDPNKLHWEERSTIVRNESDKEVFIKSGIELILPLVEECFSHPVLPIAKEDTTMKNACRVANLESYLHQADMALRNCVSEQLKQTTSESLSNEAKADLAKKANTVRRKILYEVRETNKLGSWSLISTTDDRTGSEHLRRIVEEKFREQIRQS